MRKFVEAMENAEALEQERLRAFEALADAQRGDPEIAMVRAQHICGGGVLNYCIEHVGDLTHRMCEHPDFIPFCGYESVHPKVIRALRYLRSTYRNPNTGEEGFYAEFMQNMRNNAVYYHADDTPAVAMEKHMAKVKACLQKYADEHKKLKVYNRAQRFGRDAAIALGEMRFDDAKFCLSQLEDMLATPEKWQAEASQYDPHYSALTESVGSVLAYHGARAPIDEWDEGETYFAADPHEARSYCRAGGCLVYECELRFNNPYRTADYDEFASAFDRLHELKAQGYDCVVFGNDEQFMVFSPSQVKVINLITDPTTL